MVFKFPTEEWQRLVSPERETWQNPKELLNATNPGKEEVWADMGCGPGYFTLPLADRVKKVYAIDYDERMLDLCRYRAESMGLKNIEYVLCTEEKIPLTSEEVDVSLLANLLHELVNPEAFLEEVRRITKQGGKIILIDWQLVPSPAGPPLEKRIPKEKALNLLIQMGFRHLSDLNTYPYHYFLVFENTLTRTT